MKILSLISVIIALFLNACTHNSHPVFSLKSKKQNQIIAFQPLDNYDTKEIDSVIQEISRYYNKRMIVLNPIETPKTFLNTELNQYSADSIINLLSHLQNDTLVEIVGLTYKPIFTIKNDKPIPYFDEKIFGLGYQPGNSCIISDFKFSIPIPKVYNHRLKSVILHEIGHNLGLSHCDNENCVMSASLGTVQALDISGAEYCAECNKKLKR